MVTVDRNVFEHRYKQLVGYTVRTLKSDAPSEISFEEGLWEKEEGYKRRIWKKAREEKLCLDTWDFVSPVTIVKNVLDTMSFFTVSGEKQNLVSESSYFNISESFHSNPNQAAEIFYDFYKNEKSSDCPAAHSSRRRRQIKFGETACLTARSGR